ncbi:MAG: formate dehydrogenase accessory sulfurtransferase FdhD [Deinococcus sp.]
MSTSAESGDSSPTSTLPVLGWRAGGWSDAPDEIGVEEPLELRVQTPDGPVSLNVTMRTPGHDRELALGWLHAEGLLTPGERPHLCPDPENPNLLTLHTPDPERLLAGRREGFTSSACGVCGSGSVERLSLRTTPPRWTAAPLSPATILALPARLSEAQPGFRASGGLHGAGLFGPGGELLAAYEDVGRHNAVDKLVGAVLAGRVGGVGLPLDDHLLVTSSRAGFEIVQKAALAGVGMVVTVGAPSSLAVETAAGLGLTLVGFVRGGRFNVYAGAERIEGALD